MTTIGATRTASLTSRSLSRQSWARVSYMTSNTLNELIAEGVRGRYILVRSDLNVPLDGSAVTDDGRIKASLPVLKKLSDAGARVLVTAHLGRPKGAPEEKYSLKPAASRLAELASFNVTLAEDTV